MAYKVVKKNVLNPQIFLMEVEAPLVAKKAEPGQFIILRIDEYGERVPFTIADFDREKGTVTIIVQIVGKTTKDLAQVEEGEEILDFAGPLGTPTPLEGLKLRLSAVVLVQLLLIRKLRNFIILVPM